MMRINMTGPGKGPWALVIIDRKRFEQGETELILGIVEVFPGVREAVAASKLQNGWMWKDTDKIMHTLREL